MIYMLIVYIFVVKVDGYMFYICLDGGIVCYRIVFFLLEIGIGWGRWIMVFFI